ncbi:hypothetical protein JANET_40 [Bacillus phage Janet]|nr:hypothetical protein JANET_40 [Bacillus phage Janet]
MTDYKYATLVTFYASTGYVGSKREEQFTLHELGWDSSMTDEETRDFINEAHDEWLANHTDMGWYTN